MRDEGFRDPARGLGRRIAVVATIVALMVGQGVMPAGATWSSMFYPKLVSVNSAGKVGNHDSEYPQITADGRYVVFVSASNLVPEVTGTDAQHVYRHDRKTGQTALVTAAVDGTSAEWDYSYAPRVSDCGRYVLFITYDAFVAEDTNNEPDLYVRDMETGEYRLIDIRGDGSPLNNVWWETINFAADGSFVAFTASGGDILGSGRTTAWHNIWGYDLRSEEATLVSAPTMGSASRDSYYSDISADGRYIVLLAGDDWDPSDTNDGLDIYVKDQDTGEVRWVDFRGDGTPSGNSAWNLEISGDGSRIVFEAWDRLLPEDTMANRDVYSYCLISEEATLVSGPHISNKGSRDPNVSDCGRYVLFYSGQPFAADDLNDAQDIYVKDMETGAFTRVPVMDQDGLPGNGIFEIHMSGNGRHVVFCSDRDLVPGDTNSRYDIYYAPVVLPWLSDGFTRLQGSNRYRTAVEVSRAAFPEGARNVVIATGENWPDALGGASLAGAVDGPALLTDSDTLTTATKAELVRLGARNVYLLGGYDAISRTVEEELNELLPGFVWRIGGPDRYATSRAVANRVVELLGNRWDGTVCVATGRDFPDAVGAAPLGAGLGWPVVLTSEPGVSGVTLPPATRNAVILGGEAAVSAAVATRLEQSLGGAEHVERVGGANRYETSAMVAQYGIDHGLLWNGVGISTGANYPDALTGGVALGLHRTTLLLTPTGSLHSAAAAKIGENKAEIESVGFLGGTNVISATVENQVKALLSK